MRETIASTARSYLNTLSASNKNLRSANFDEIEELHKEGSVLTDDHSFDDDGKEKKYNENDNSDFNDDDDENDENYSGKKTKRKPYWKDILRQESREDAKDCLKKLENKVRYLPNPRLDAIRIGNLYKF